MTKINTKNSKVALVTGAARRIGAAIVSQLHQAGYRIALHYHYSEQEAIRLAAPLNQQRPDSVGLFAADLADVTAIKQLIPTVSAWAGRLDLLVNNASIFTRTTVTNINVDDLDALFRINVYAPLLLSSAALPLLQLTQGVIINITDIHAEKPLVDYASYCQTKAALVMQTKALAREFAPSVRVNAVAPGAIAWPEQDNALSVAQQAKIIAKTPLQCHGKPAFIAQAVLALADNPFITGQVLNIDGGRSVI